MSNLVAHDGEVPRDPSDWGDMDMFHLITHRLHKEEGILPEIAYLGMWFCGELCEDTRISFDIEDACLDASGNIIPGIAISLSDDALIWFRDTPEGTACMARVAALMEKQIYVEDWGREIE